jgi:C1A family cysteine protease
MTPPGELSVARLQQMLKDAGVPWEADVTSVSELPKDQKRRLLGYEPGPREESLETRERAARTRLEEAQVAAGALRAAAYPASFDLRNVGGKNYITPIKDQRTCGSCVAFGTAATVEGTVRWLRNDPKLEVDYSEAQLFYCIARAQGRNCDNGWSVEPALDGFQDPGIVDESCFPYTAGDQGCGLCGDWQKRVTNITGWHSVGSHTDMKQWLSTRGPLVTCFTVYDDFYSYKSGIYSHVSGDFTGGHCVSCVGYNDAGGYWICKNSWGSGFGESGYFRIAYGQVGIDSTMWAVEGVQAGISFSGVWRAGSDAHYVWVNASWDSFRAKWEELSKQNLRLVDLDVYTIGGNTVWAGVWRAGSDAHYVWVNASWDNFRAKWEELSKQNLRLTVLTTYQVGGTRLYAGVWRAGSDAYYVWVNASWDNFRAKWEELSKQNLRLIHLDTWTSGMTAQTGGSEVIMMVHGRGSEAAHVIEGGSSEAGQASVKEGGGGSVQAGFGEGGGSGSAQAGVGEGGSVGTQAGVGEGGGSVGTQAGVDEGGGSVGTQAGVGEGGGSVGTQAGVGEGGGSVGTQAGVGEGGGSVGTQAAVGKTRAVY